MSAIVLTTLNARYIHTTFGLRYLKANLGGLAHDCEIVEFTIHERPIDIAERLLSLRPDVIGFGVYIWNVAEITETVALIKQISPDTIVVLGGPEVSYEQQQQEVCRLSDYVIAGPGDLSFRDLCRQISQGVRSAEKYIPQQVPPLEEIKFPYHLYNDKDVAHRIVYVEASRGCPFKCEFCLSALDKTAWPFDLDQFLSQMEMLYNRGVRHFKFVDRTFNLKVDSSIRILEFFLARMDDDLFLHFELIPDHLPERLKEVIARFPENSLQFEIGVQSFNPETQRLISRRQDNQKTESSLAWIRNKTHAHIHCDLIIGLPGEDMASFAAGLNRLVRLDPHEIQVGILKRLRGAPIARHVDEFELRFNPYPPYNILSNNLIGFDDMQRLSRFARYWDMIINSGRFKHSKVLIFGDDPFQCFMLLSDWLYAVTGQTHRIALRRLFELLYEALTEQLDKDVAETTRLLSADYERSGLKGRPLFLHGLKGSKDRIISVVNRRQQRH
jgi:radical SAM superfamily enzyme YgiQ (UPF0313 family)